MTGPWVNAMRLNEQRTKILNGWIYMNEEDFLGGGGGGEEEEEEELCKYIGVLRPVNQWEEEGGGGGGGEEEEEEELRRRRRRRSLR